MADEMAAFMMDVYNCTEVHIAQDDSSRRDPAVTGDGSAFPSSGGGVGPAKDVLNGGKVDLLLYLRPKADQLETVANRFPGVSGDKWKQLACWNIVTSSLEVRMELIPASAPGLAMAAGGSSAAGSEKLMLFPGRMGVPHVVSPSAVAGRQKELAGVVYPSRAATLVQQAVWCGDAGEECQPSIYTLSFIVHVPEMPSGEGAFRVQMALDVGDLARITAKMAGLTDVALPHVSGRNTPYAVRVTAGALCERSAEEDVAVLRQLRMVGSVEEDAVDSCLLTLLWPLQVVDPLAVDVTHAEPSPGRNLIQVTITNTIAQRITVADACIHLPTTLPAGQLPSGFDTLAAPGALLCSLSTIPSLFDAAVFGNGFEGFTKMQCYMVSGGEEDAVLPVVVDGGESYAFVFAIHPYDAAPHARGSAGSPRASEDAGRTEAQQSTLTVSFAVEGADAVLDREVKVLWNMMTAAGARPPAQTADVIDTNPHFFSPSIAQTAG